MKIEPRFIHCPDSSISKKHSGFTVAYMRNDLNVVFGYSLCPRSDQYRKDIGRIQSLKALKESHEYVAFNVAEIQLRYSNKESRSGIINVTDLLKHIGGLDQVLADQTIANLTPKDFKHAHISQAIVYSINYDLL